MNVPGWSSFSITNAVFYLKACPIGVLSLTTKWKVLPRSGQWLRFEPSGLKFFFRGKIRSLIMMSLLDIVMVRRHLLKVGVVVVVVHLLLQKCFFSSCAKIQLSSKLVHLYFWRRFFYFDKDHHHMFSFGFLENNNMTCFCANSDDMIPKIAASTWNLNRLLFTYYL